MGAVILENPDPDTVGWSRIGAAVRTEPGCTCYGYPEHSAMCPAYRCESVVLGAGLRWCTKHGKWLSSGARVCSAIAEFRESAELAHLLIGRVPPKTWLRWARGL
jgi:hypothetical protein